MRERTSRMFPSDSTAPTGTRWHPTSTTIDTPSPFPHPTPCTHVQCAHLPTCTCSNTAPGASLCASSATPHSSMTSATCIPSPSPTSPLPAHPLASAVRDPAAPHSVPEAPPSTSDRACAPVAHIVRISSTNRVQGVCTSSSHRAHQQHKSCANRLHEQLTSCAPAAHIVRISSTNRVKGVCISSSYRVHQQSTSCASAAQIVCKACASAAHILCISSPHRAHLWCWWRLRLLQQLARRRGPPAGPGSAHHQRRAPAVSCERTWAIAITASSRGKSSSASEASMYTCQCVHSVTVTYDRDNHDIWPAPL